MADPPTPEDALRASIASLPAADPPPPENPIFTYTLDARIGGPGWIPCYHFGTMVFDESRGHLLVADGLHCCVLVFNAENGSFIKLINLPEHAGVGVRPHGLYVDTHRDELVVASYRRIDSRSLVDCTTVTATLDMAINVMEFGHVGSTGTVLSDGRTVLIGNGAHGLEIVTDLPVTRMVMKELPNHPNGWILYDPIKHCTTVYNSPKCPIRHCHATCLDHLARVITLWRRFAQTSIEVFTADGEEVANLTPLNNLDPSNYMMKLDSTRGLLAVGSPEVIRVIGANKWLPSTFIWRPDRHRHAPSEMGVAVLTLTTVLRLPELRLPWLPNELLFEIFERL